MYIVPSPTAAVNGARNNESADDAKTVGEITPLSAPETAESTAPREDCVTPVTSLTMDSNCDSKALSSLERTLCMAFSAADSKASRPSSANEQPPEAQSASRQQLKQHRNPKQLQVSEPATLDFKTYFKN